MTKKNVNYCVQPETEVDRNMCKSPIFTFVFQWRSQFNVRKSLLMLETSFSLQEALRWVLTILMYDKLEGALRKLGVYPVSPRAYNVLWFHDFFWKLATYYAHPETEVESWLKSNLAFRRGKLVKPPQHISKPKSFSLCFSMKKPV